MEWDKVSTYKIDQYQHRVIVFVISIGFDYRQYFNISRTLVGKNIVEDSDVVGASPVGAAPTTSSFAT